MTEGRTIAIGDVHACSAALAALVRGIDLTELDTLVFLGDYIDRGPDSRGVLEQVIGLAERWSVVPLLGNHEEMLLAALEGQSELRYWLKFGGTEALASSGYKGGAELRPADLRSLIPAEHLQFIKGCRDYFETVRHIFVHAYYEPDRPLHQRWGGLRWASLPPVPARHCSGQGGHRRSHSAEERRSSGPGLPEVHRHLLPRRGLADGAGGQDREGLAGEPGGGDATGMSGLFRPTCDHQRLGLAVMG
jgi:serine/threonine protein phosphatase 1